MGATIFGEPYRGPTGRQKETTTIWGIPYLPCIFFDRLLWHRNQDPEIQPVALH